LPRAFLDTIGHLGFCGNLPVVVSIAPRWLNARCEHRLEYRFDFVSTIFAGSKENLHAIPSLGADLPGRFSPARAFGFFPLGLVAVGYVAVGIRPE
jgi:hypothetical protein